MLDMERQEVLALLEGRDKPDPSPVRARGASPYATPRSPVRSMLDVDVPPNPSSPRQAPVRSMLDIDSPSPPPSIRSMLDVNTKPTAKQPGTATQPNSPVATKASLATPGVSFHTRSFSDASSKPVEFGPRAGFGRASGGDHTSEYQFGGILSQNPTTSMPKRNTQAGKGRKSSQGSRNDSLRSNDMGGLQLPSDRGRHHSLGGQGQKSKSPQDSNRLGSRSRSPNPPLGAGRVMLDDGQTIDLSNAYRRLSDAKLALSRGGLSELPKRQVIEEDGHGRLVKDYLGPDGEELSSDEDEPYSSSDEDRGRKKDPRALNHSKQGESRPTLSLLAAAEEERTCQSSNHSFNSSTNLLTGTQIASQQPKYVYRSLLSEPEIKVTNPSGDNVKTSKSSVHPNTSYDQDPASASASVMDSDEEADRDDISKAQKLSFTMTNIQTNNEAHRAIRLIYRGEYSKIAQLAEEENRRLRKYLVAMDLSEESTHALEWAIGTVLRDGDTLIAICCVDEETGVVGDAALVADDPKAMREQATAINSVANNKSMPPPITAVPDFMRSTAFHLRGDSKSSTPTTSPAPSSRADRGKADEERRRVVKDVTERVLRLLRKTTLQIRVIVEVIHCKNPKHLITEVIDLVNPTLVVIGSRGRSALKG